MASIIVITKVQDGCKKRYLFNLPVEERLAIIDTATAITEFACSEEDFDTDIVVNRARFYKTGLGSLPTYKKIVAACRRLQEPGVTYIVEREQVPDHVITARGIPGQRAPKYGRGG